MQPERAQTSNLSAGRVATPFWAHRFLRVIGALSLVLGSLIGLTVSVGCSRNPLPPQPHKRFQGLRITVACPGEPAVTIVQRYSQLWAALTGARIEAVLYDPAMGPETEPAADLWILSPARMPYWADAAKLHQVPETLTDGTAGYAWQNILPLYRYKLCVWDQKVYGLPLLGDALVCFYREDLFQSPRHRNAFKKNYGRELVPPVTWEEFAQIAEYFHNQERPGIDRPCASLPPLPQNLDELDRMFYSVAAPCVRRAVREDDPKPPPDVELFSFHYDFTSGAVRIDTPGFVYALHLLQRLQAFRPSGVVPDPPAALQKGEAVLCVASPAWISRFQENPAVRDKFGLCRLPGSAHVFDYATGQDQRAAGANWVPYLGADGWMMVVPRSNADPEAAFALAASLSDPKTSQDVVIEPGWGGGVFRREHLEAGLGWHQLGLDRRRTENLVNILRETVLHPQVKNPVLRLRTPDERTHQQALDVELRAALVGRKDAAQALREAAQRWRQIDERKDIKTRLRGYRLSLSLSP